MSALLLALSLMAPEEPAHPLAGCFQPQELASRLAQLRALRWGNWTPAMLAKTWPTGLEAAARDHETNVVVGYRRPGRLIEGHVECGELYLFETPSSPGGERLREVTFSHAELSRPEALASARLFIQAVAPPPDGGPAQTICIDCGDPGEQILSRRWTLEGETSMLQIYLRPGVRSFVVAVTWSQRRW